MKNAFLSVFIPTFFGVWIICSAIYLIEFNHIGGDINANLVIKALAVFFVVALFLATIFLIGSSKKGVGR